MLKKSGTVYLIPLMILVFLLSCSKNLTVQDDQFIPPDEYTEPLPKYSQRVGDAAAGEYYLLNGDYVDSGIPLQIFGKFFSGQVDELQRGGLNENIHHEYNAFLNEEDVAIVSPNCLQCHAGYIDGQFILGLGNTDADFTMDASAFVNLMDGGIASVFGKDSPEWRGYERFSRALKMTGGEIITEVVGANSADKLAAVLAAHRDQDDLSWHEEEMINLPDEVIPTDVPAWWLLKKKHAMFYTAVGRGDFARISMASSALTLQDSTKAREIDKNFVDVIAFINSLEAPEYTGTIDTERANAGRLIFNDNCSSCHGRYDDQAHYPNLLVDVSLVKTDALLLSSNFGYGVFVDWYNGSWFGQDPNKAMLVPGNGYIAPPLDGVWATAPYLHNGSVPTIEALLNSPTRPEIWKKTEAYNHKSVGLNYIEMDSKVDKFTYDTNLRGYSNVGHYFGDRLTEEERSLVLEYLKTL